MLGNIILFLTIVTILFFSKAMFGLKRLFKRPKMIQFYNHQADMVDMIMNTLMFVFGLSFVLAYHLGLA